MSIKATCSECGRSYNVPDSRAGQTLECKGCGAEFDVPDGEDMGEEEERPSRQRRPKPEKKGGSMMPWLIGGGVAAVLLLLVVCGGVIAVIFTMGVGSGAGKASPENFAKVKRGMTEQQVTTLMGPPQQGVQTIPGIDLEMKAMGANAKKLSWSGSNNFTGHVVMVDGTVQGALGTDGRNVYAPLLDDDLNPDKGKAPNDGGKPAQPKGFTKETVDTFNSRVRAGMSEKDVVTLLGNPDTRNAIAAQQVGDLKVPASTHLTWGRLGADHLNITFRDDKLAVANGSFQGKRLRLNK